MHGVRAAWLKSEAANVQHISFSVSEMTNEKKKKKKTSGRSWFLQLEIPKHYNNYNT